MNVVDTVLNEINYKISFKGYLIIAKVIENWGAFLKITDKNQFDGFSDTVKCLSLQNNLRTGNYHIRPAQADVNWSTKNSDSSQIIVLKGQRYAKIDVVCLNL